MNARDHAHRNTVAITSGLGAAALATTITVALVVGRSDSADASTSSTSSTGSTSTQSDQSSQSDSNQSSSGSSGSTGISPGSGSADATSGGS
jgi:hypothetical protein